MRLVEIDRQSKDLAEWLLAHSSPEYPAVSALSAAIIGGHNNTLSAQDLYNKCLQGVCDSASNTLEDCLHLNHFTDAQVGTVIANYIPFCIESQQHPWQRAVLDGVNLDCTSAILLRRASLTELNGDLVPLHFYDECQWIHIASDGALDHVLMCRVGLDKKQVIVDIVLPDPKRQNELLNLVSQWRKVVIEQQHAWTTDQQIQSNASFKAAA